MRVQGGKDVAASDSTGAATETTGAGEDVVLVFDGYQSDRKIRTDFVISALYRNRRGKLAVCVLFRAVARSRFH